MKLQWRKVFYEAEYGAEYGDFIGFNRFGEPLARIHTIWTRPDGSPIRIGEFNEYQFKQYNIFIYNQKYSSYIKFEEFDRKKAMLYAENIIGDIEE